MAVIRKEYKPFCYAYHSLTNVREEKRGEEKGEEQRSGEKRREQEEEERK